MSPLKCTTNLAAKKTGDASVNDKNAVTPGRLQKRKRMLKYAKSFDSHTFRSANAQCAENLRMGAPAEHSR